MILRYLPSVGVRRTLHHGIELVTGQHIHRRRSSSGVVEVGRGWVMGAVMVEVGVVDRTQKLGRYAGRQDTTATASSCTAAGRVRAGRTVDAGARAVPAAAHQAACPPVRGGGAVVAVVW